jgi:hypothetical protein
MDTLVENRNTMHVNTQSCLEANDEKMTGMPDYTAFKSEFSSNLKDTGKLLGELSLSSKGVAQDKNAAKLLLIADIMKVSRIMVAYATSKEIFELLKKVKLAESRLVKMQDTALKDAADEILRIANENKTILLTYGLTGQMLVDAQTKTDVYFAIMPKPKLTKKREQEIRKEIKERQKQSDKILGKIDAMVATLEETEPLFCGTYFGMRKVDHAGLRHLSLKVQVNDSETKMGVKGVVLEIEQQAGNGKEAGTELTKSVKRTGDKGGCFIKNLGSGTYLIKAGKEGYVTQMITAYVNEGEMTGIVIEIAKI